MESVSVQQPKTLSEFAGSSTSSSDPLIIHSKTAESEEARRQHRDKLRLKEIEETKKDKIRQQQEKERIKKQLEEDRKNRKQKLTTTHTEVNTKIEPTQSTTQPTTQPTTCLLQV